jgi:hypothetical protein
MEVRLEIILTLSSIARKRGFLIQIPVFGQKWLQKILQEDVVAET